MSGSGGSTQTQQNKDPWAPAQPHLRNIMQEALGLYGAGEGSRIWGGDLIGAMDPTMTEGFDATRSVARGAMPSAAQPFNAAVSGAASGGMTPGMAQPMGILSGVASGQNNINTGGQYAGLLDRSLTQNANPNSVMDTIARGGIPLTGINTGDQYRSVSDAAAGPTAADTYLTDVARGGGTNPHLQAMLDANSARISNRVNSAMSGAGRYGSGGHTDVLARSIAEANNPILAQAYESDQNRRLAATGQIDASRRGADATRLAGIAGQTDVQGRNIADQFTNAGLRLNAAGGLASGNRADMAGAGGLLGGLTSVQGQNIANQTGAAGGLLDTLARGQSQAQAWAALAPTLNELQYDPANRLTGVGSMLTARNQQELDAQRALFEQRELMPWTQLQRYQGAVSGLGPLLAGMGSTTGSESKSASWNDLAKLGANVGAFFLSDRDAKTDIKKIGTSETTGLPLYSYRYKGDSKSYPKVVGPMAQDIAKKFPDAVTKVAGMLAIKPQAAGLLGAI